MLTLNKFLNKNNKKAWIKLFLLMQETQILEQRPQISLNLFVISFTKIIYNFIKSQNGCKIQDIIGI